MVKNIILISFALYSISCSKNEIEDQSEIVGCMDEFSDNYNSFATVDDGSCVYFGCMDTAAINYDSVATNDDGNCVYQQGIIEGYHLFWNDEFNQDSLNLKFWNIEEWWIGAFNDESQSYENSRENIIIIDGNLYIRAKKGMPLTLITQFTPQVESIQKIKLNYNMVTGKYGLNYHQGLARGQLFGC